MPNQVELSIDQVPELVKRALALYHNKNKTNESSRVLISLAGIPGSGKSTLSTEVVRQLNKQIKAIVLPQDGYHLYRSELNQLPNPQEAFIRRGAPFTFDAKKFLDLIAKLKDPDYTHKTLKAPSFDHRLKDPLENDIIIDADTKIIIIEGNYVSLKDSYWDDIGSYVDESWFMNTPLLLVRERVIKRHLEAGIASNQEEAIERADGSDLLNANYILDKSKTTDVIIVTK